MTAATDGQPGPVRRTGADVVDQLRLLWPEPSGVELVGRRQARRDGTALQFVPLPNAAHPRILVPTGSSAVAAGALRGGRVATDTRARLRTAAAVGVARLGLLAAHPDRIVVRGETGVTDADGATIVPLVDRLREVLGEVTPAFYIGPVRAVQKPVIQLLDRRGRTTAFAKVGVNVFTNELVATEADALRRVGQHQWSTMRVPHVLLHEQWNGHEVLVQEALPIDGSPMIGTVSAAAVEVAAFEPQQEHALSALPWWHEIVTRVSGATHAGSVSGALTEAVQALDVRATEHRVTVGCAHLDWAPWNMARTGGSLGVWDWEQFSSGVPVGYDALHHAVQDAVVLRQRNPLEVMSSVRGQAAELLRPFGLSDAEADLTMLLYVLDLASRYQRDQETGTRLSRLHGWLAPTLASFGQLSGAGRA